MIEYRSKILSNGLEVVVNRDQASKMAAVNLLYRVGSKHESPERTGFAHLFEHLMFRGTERVPDFDAPVQAACGENNAYTTADYTNFYITLPRENIATALYLEADRMTGLNISPEALAAEKSVVVEEFNQRYLNQPYGDQWMLLRGEAYQKSHYRWATIGLSPDHIRAASLDEVRAFYDRFYQPSNAILSLSADIPEDEMIAMAEEWFGDIPSTPAPLFVPEAEPVQSAPRRLEVERAVPADQITIAIRMEHRNSRCHYLCDLLTDLMAGGESARFYQRLVKEQQIFSSTNAYITGEVDGGLFIAIGQLNPGVTIEEAEAAVWRELLLFATEPVGEKELEKVRNKFEANILFGELNVMNKAMNLSYYAMLGDMSLLNGEVAIYNSITPEEIMDFAQKFFRHDQSTTLVIRSKQ